MKIYLGLALGCLLLLSCGVPLEPQSVILITLDTTRADHLGAYGFTEASTPNLDAFARESVLFQNAISVAPITFPSHASMMTGTFPIHHGVHDNDGYILDEDVETLAEILQKEGYVTGAVVSATPLRSGVRLDQGFQTYNDHFREDWSARQIAEREKTPFAFLERTADQTNRAAFRWLEKHKDEPKVFLWVHYFDPHQSYRPPPPYDSMFALAPYDGEIAFLDEHFGRLIAKLKEVGTYSRSLVLVVGDHGEGLEEHGEPTHANYIYDATSRVPWLMADSKRPQRKGTVVEPMVRTVDIAPTVLGSLGLALGDAMQGQDLTAVIDQGAQAPQQTLIESYYSFYHYGWSPLRALRTPAWKYIEGPKPELYDLRVDPGETRNIVASNPERARDMEEALYRFARQHKTRNPGRSVAETTDPEDLERLAALGYAAGATNSAKLGRKFPPKSKYTNLRNPMDNPRILYYISLSEELVRSSNYDLGIQASRQGINLDPTNSRLHFNLARSLAGIGAYEGAEKSLRQAIAIDGADPSYFRLLGLLLSRRGQTEPALHAFEEALRRSPDSIDLLTLVSRSWETLGHPHEAIAHLKAAQALAPNRPDLPLAMAKLLLHTDRLTEAKAAAEQAHQLSRGEPRLTYEVGKVLVSAGDRQESSKMFRQVIERVPAHLGARYRLAKNLQAEGQEEEADRLLAEMIRLSPEGSPWIQRATDLRSQLELTRP